MNRQIPLLFTYQDRVVGMGFSALVATYGRVLAVEEAGESDVWIYGVEPGALAAKGADPKEALEAFRQSFTNVLRDFAAEPHGFTEFESAVQQFFSEVNEPNEQDWLRAVEAVRAGTLDMPHVRREPAETRRFVQVQQEMPVDLGKDHFAITGSQITSALAA
jgi:hypothetical protein